MCYSRLVSICYHLIIFNLLIFSFNGYAQNLDDYIAISEPASWIDVQDIPKDEFDLAKDNKLSYKLLSRQRRHTTSCYHSYNRYVIDLKTASAVEDEGTVTVNFDPSYAKIKFHHIWIINSEGVRSVLNLDDAELFRTETDREKLLFDRTLQFSLG